MLWKHRREGTQTAIFQAKKKKERGRGSDHSHRGLHCKAHTDAEKNRRMAGTQGSGMRNTELESGHPGSGKTTSLALYPVNT